MCFDVHLPPASTVLAHTGNVPVRTFVKVRPFRIDMIKFLNQSDGTCKTPEVLQASPESAPVFQPYDGTRFAGDGKGGAKQLK